VKNPEWEKMPKKTRSALAEMCKVATEQFDPDTKRRKLAKAIADMLFRLQFRTSRQSLFNRIEQLLNKHGI